MCSYLPGTATTLCSKNHAMHCTVLHMAFLVAGCNVIYCYWCLVLEVLANSSCGNVVLLRYKKSDSAWRRKSGNWPLEADNTCLNWTASELTWKTSRNKETLLWGMQHPVLYVGHLWQLLLLCLSTPAGTQAADDTPPLRPILCLALRFAPAQFHASQLLLNCPLPCVLWSSCVSTTLRGPSQSFFVILLPAFLIVCPIQVHFLWVIVVSVESCSAMFHNSLLVILSFQ